MKKRTSLLDVSKLASKMAVDAGLNFDTALVEFQQWTKDGGARIEEPCVYVCFYSDAGNFHGSEKTGIDAIKIAIASYLGRNILPETGSGHTL